jgi:hypothetical protein
MSDDETPAGSVWGLLTWFESLGGEPLSIAELHDLKRALEAGAAVPLTQREIRILATCGLIVGHAAHEHARQFFERMAPRMIAEIVARMGTPDDDPEGGSKPS